MKPTHIVLTDKGIGCIEVPDKSPYTHYDDWIERYGVAFRQAVDNVVLFKPEQNESIKKLLFQKGFALLHNEGYLYPVPDGYEIKIKKEVMSIGDHNVWIEVNNNWLEDTYNANADYAKRQYAILVPKQEPEKCPKCRTTDFASCHSMRCPMRKDEPVKQPTSIEEAAEQSWDVDAKIRRPEPCNPHAYKAGFVAGAKSEAAKEYWFEIFKQEKK